MCVLVAANGDQDDKEVGGAVALCAGASLNKRGDRQILMMMMMIKVTATLVYAGGGGGDSVVCCVLCFALLVCCGFTKSTRPRFTRCCQSFLFSPFFLPLELFGGLFAHCTRDSKRNGKPGSICVCVSFFVHFWVVPPLRCFAFPLLGTCMWVCSCLDFLGAFGFLCFRDLPP